MPRESSKQRPEEAGAELAASRAELKRVAALLVAGEEEARRRIARELHDDFGQRLTAQALALKAVRNRLAVGDPRRSELDAAAGGMTELAEDLRRLSHDLHPTALEHRGLVEALRDHCGEVEQRFGLPVRLSLRDAGAPIPPDVALGLYRVAQEALANVARHAGARAVHVTLTIATGAARLAIADDGAGFDPAEARAAGGLGLASVEERARMLGGRCRFASAPGAGTEVEVTLPLPEPAGELTAAASGSGDDHRSQRTVGPYRLLGELGGGPTTTVYLAEEPAPLARLVAIKLLRGALPGPLPGRLERLRFEAEQQALARLHHPAVAAVYEAQATERGDLYVVMEYVSGSPITSYCDRRGLDLEARLELFAIVCDGVGAAHKRAVLHRDLEPANILVVEEGGVAAPKLVGFGAAAGAERSAAAGEPAASRPYRAPETLAGGEVDTRSDLYSLGVVLYELLVGCSPAEAGPETAAEPATAAGVTGVVPPSRRLRRMEAAAAAEVARRRGGGGARRLGRRLAGDLDRLVGRALAADPAARYPTVDAFGEEVRRVLRGEPVEAGPPGALPQLVRLVRRHRHLVAAAAVVILALAAGLAATAVQARRAVREAARADAVSHFLEELFVASDPRQARGELPDARELLRRGSDRLHDELREQPLTRARLLATLGGIHTELGLYDEARPLLEEALELRQRLRGSDHPEVAATLVRLGVLAHLSGQGDAEALFRRALAIRERRLGSDDPGVADVLNKLGATLAAQGRFDEAEEILQRSLALQEEILGDGNPRVAKVLHNLSGIAYYRGRTEEARELLERALAIRERALSEDDPDLAGSREALALLHQQQGRAAEATALLEQLVGTAERVYGPEHPALARALLNLGLVRRDLGDDEAARELFERALAINEKALAPDQPVLVRSLAALAEEHLRQGRFAAAEPLYRRLLALHAQGTAYADWDRVLAQWDQLLSATGRPQEALSGAPLPPPAATP